MTDRATVEELKRQFGTALFEALGRFPAGATRNDLYIALALVAYQQLALVRRTAAAASG